MATCLTSINEVGEQLIELSSEAVYPATINNTKNALFLLSNDMDQSVFFTVRVIGAVSNISFSLTIYNTETLVQFGSLSVTLGNISTSFNIKAGTYYVCIRSQILSYNIELTPKFISYNKTATFNAKSYIGVASETIELKTSRPVGVCRRRLVYTIIEGNLPNGLTMLENGYISGYLPILDTDNFNYDLPPSNTWYHKIGDDEYVTSWGRAYRFRVHLTLYDDRSKEDIRWFYITIINDFSKNLALIDKYEMLDDERDVTFEEKIKLATVSLCPPCTIDDVIDITGGMSNSNNGTGTSSNNGTGKELTSIDNLFSDSSDFVVDDETYNKENLYKLIEGNDTKKLFDTVENNIIEDEDNILIFDADFNNTSPGEEGQSIELIYIPPSDNIAFTGDAPTFSNISQEEGIFDSLEGITNKKEQSLAEYYITNFDNDEDDFIVQLKDSSMYQSYLKENNISEEYIIEYPLERETYEKVKLDYITVKDEITKAESHYVQLMTGEAESDDANTTEDASILFEQKYLEELSKLPLTTYSVYGWHAEAKLVLEGK